MFFAISVFFRIEIYLYRLRKKSNFIRHVSDGKAVEASIIYLKASNNKHKLKTTQSG